VFEIKIYHRLDGGVRGGGRESGIGG